MPLTPESLWVSLTAAEAGIRCSKSVNTQITLLTDNQIKIIGVTNGSYKYLLWQVDEEDRENIYFEYDDQKNGGYNIVQECTIMFDGLHLVLTSGVMVHFYFNNLARLEYQYLVETLKDIYSQRPRIMDVLDNYI